MSEPNRNQDPPETEELSVEELENIAGGTLNNDDINNCPVTIENYSQCKC